MKEPVFYSDTHGRTLFGYHVESDEMSPSFAKGDVAIINPNLHARNGDYVVARKRDKCMLRLYVEVSDEPLLVTVGSDGPSFPARSSIILGRVVERRRSYK